MDKKTIIAIVFYVCVPVFTGALFYFIYFPDSVLVNLMENCFGAGVHRSWDYSNVILRLIRFYLLDFLWALALMASALLICRDIKARKVLLIVICFEVVMESAQLCGFVPGTFDPVDLLVEMLANITMIIIFKRRIGI